MVTGRTSSATSLAGSPEESDERAAWPRWIREQFDQSVMASKYARLMRKVISEFHE